MVRMVGPSTGPLVYRLSGRTSRVVTSIKTAHQLTLPTANLLLYIGPYGVPVYRATMRLYRPEQDVGWPFGTSGIGFSKGDRVDDNDVVISLPLV